MTRRKLVGLPIGCARQKDAGTNLPTKTRPAICMLPVDSTAVSTSLWLNFAPDPPASPREVLLLTQGPERRNK